MTEPESSVGGGGPRVRPPQEGRCPTCGLEDQRYYRAKLEYIGELEAQLIDLRGERDHLNVELAFARAEREELRAERDALRLERVAGAIHRSIVKDEPGRPVAAPCAISGCQYGDLETDLEALRGAGTALQQQLDELHGAKFSERVYHALKAQARALERLALCPDHRDKATGTCIVCQAETRTRQELDADLTRLRSRGQAVVQQLGDVREDLRWAARLADPDALVERLEEAANKIQACADALTAALQEPS